MTLVEIAKSGDFSFIQQISDSKLSGYVHSTFNRTFNIHCLENGELYTIACREMDNGPNTLIIDVDRFDEMDIKVNDTVHFENKILSVENKIAITLEQVESWKPVLPIYPKDTEIIKTRLTKMKHYINILGKGGGMKKNKISRGPFDVEMSKMLNERTNLLLNALRNNEMSKALQHAVSLIGLGPGLTPSGDDFLVGLFTIFNIRNSPRFSHQSFCEDVVEKAKALTNDISYMALKKASVGKVRESIIRLVDSLFYGKEEELFFSLNQVINIGSSSGTDIALGLVSGLEANINQEGNYGSKSFN
ncbi:hypothetical protein BN000_01805 [Neobacillus massiliamazoniensis]|uniref:DUF2877 domain-containing protein n=1 Tax=Neobacillus massiliamazoniensis TaxID=1499688 RepID=A0A0U1NVP3_9BACI|nr:hypothetical protein BN000_01805 [Neobacillus massiliamazoniensis]